MSKYRVGPEPHPNYQILPTPHWLTLATRLMPDRFNQQYIAAVFCRESAPAFALQSDVPVTVHMSTGASSQCVAHNDAMEAMLGFAEDSTGLPSTGKKKFDREQHTQTLPVSKEIRNQLLFSHSHQPSAEELSRLVLLKKADGTVIIAKVSQITFDFAGQRFHVKTFQDKTAQYQLDAVNRLVSCLTSFEDSAARDVYQLAESAATTLDDATRARLQNTDLLLDLIHFVTGEPRSHYTNLTQEVQAQVTWAQQQFEQTLRERGITLSVGDIPELQYIIKTPHNIATSLQKQLEDAIRNSSYDSTIAVSLIILASENSELQFKVVAKSSSLDAEVGLTSDRSLTAETATTAVSLRRFHQRLVGSSIRVAAEAAEEKADASHSMPEPASVELTETAQLIFVTKEPVRDVMNYCAETVDMSGNTLAVDDQATVLRTLESTLRKKLGAHVIIAVDGANACQVMGLPVTQGDFDDKQVPKITAHPGPFARVVTDNNMPNMRGVEFVRRLALAQTNKPGEPKIPVAIVSGDSVTDLFAAVQGVSNPVVIIQKPATPEKLSLAFRFMQTQLQLQQDAKLSAPTGSAALYQHQQPAQLKPLDTAACQSDSQSEPEEETALQGQERPGTRRDSHATTHTL